jgi:hypothetical protein
MEMAAARQAGKRLIHIYELQRPGLEGKTLTVTLPGDAAFAVFDEKNVCVNFTTVSKNNTTLLPQKGKIALIGNTGDIFDINIQ